MAITVEDVGPFLRSRGEYGTATVVVPDRAVGALMSVVQVTRGLDRLADFLENRAKTHEKEVRDAERLARTSASKAKRDTLRSGPDAKGIMGVAGIGGLGSTEESSGGGGGEGILGSALETIGGMAAIKSVGRLAARGLRLGLRFAPLIGGAVGAYGVYKDIQAGGDIGYGDAILGGAGIGAAIGSIIPGVGTAIGAIVGGAIGGIGTAVYNNTSSISRAWDSTKSAVTGAAQKLADGTVRAWDSAVGAVDNTISSATTSLSSAWSSLKETTSKYRTRIEDWLAAQGLSISEWFGSITSALRETVSIAHLRDLALKWLLELKQWVFGKFGFGGGGGGGGADAGGTPGGGTPGGGGGGDRGGAQPASPTSAPSAPVGEDDPHRFVQPAGAYTAPGMKATPEQGRVTPGLQAFGQQALSPATPFGSDETIPSDAPSVSPSQAGIGKIGGSSTQTPAFSQFGGSMPIDRLGSRTDAVGASPVAMGAANARNFEGTNVGLRPGRNPDLEHVDPRLVETLKAGAAHLPPGYRVEISEGYTPYGHAPGSEHKKAGSGAMDFAIIDPQGNKLQNNGGNDPTGLYTQIHRHMEGELAARYPELAKEHRLGHGADFQTSRMSGRADWMHIDFGGARGHGMGHTPIHLQGAMPGELYGQAFIDSKAKPTDVAKETPKTALPEAGAVAAEQATPKTETFEELRARTYKRIEELGGVAPTIDTPPQQDWRTYGSGTVEPEKSVEPTTIKESTGEKDTSASDKTSDKSDSGSADVKQPKVSMDDIPTHTPNAKLAVASMTDKH